MIQEKVIKNLQPLGVGVAKYFRVSMRCPKSRFSIRIIVFDELELIIFASQDLTLLHCKNCQSHGSSISSKGCSEIIQTTF